MDLFPTERDAKEFLVGEIAAEADRQGQPLTDIERKMLYFSESGWTLDDMDEVAEAFEREHDSAEYEGKIGRLAQGARNQIDGSTWSAAVERLAEGDHYLLVMVSRAGGPDAMTWRGVVAVVAFLVVVVAAAAGLKHLWPNYPVSLFLLACVVAGVVIYNWLRLRRRWI